jgi:hypothetical protein
VDSEPKIINVNNDPFAPEIVNAWYNFGHIRNGNKAPDTLIVAFDKPVYYDTNNELVFWFWINNITMYPNPVTVRPINGSNNGEQQWTFVIVENTREPVSGDLINIRSGYERGVNNDTAGVIHDVWGNYTQINNPKVPLTIGQKPINVSVVVIPGGSIVIDDSNITPLQRDPIVDDVLGSGNGSIIIIDPGISLPNDDGTGTGTLLNRVERVYAVILDAVGNKVAETNDRGSGENLGAVVSGIGIDQRNVLTVAWNNKNSSGRDVGAGVYLLLVESKWEGNNKIFRDRKVIPVPHKKKK